MQTRTTTATDLAQAQFFRSRCMFSARFLRRKQVALVTEELFAFHDSRETSREMVTVATAQADVVSQSCAAGIVSLQHVRARLTERQFSWEVPCTTRV
jgi:maleate cis-trans isomerase